MVISHLQRSLKETRRTKTTTKMFKMFNVTLFLVLSISMLTQSAPAADPEPQDCSFTRNHCALIPTGPGPQDFITDCILLNDKGERC